MTCAVKDIQLKINTQQDVLLIDLSYYIFYRYHAFVNWYQLAKEIKLTNDNVEEEFTKPETIEHFKKLCLNKIEELRGKKKDKITDNYNIYLLKDCKRSEIWRNDIVNNYKEGRTQKLFVKTLFAEGINEVLTNSGYQVISQSTLEADDLAYISVKNLKENKILNFNKNIKIITDDSDYIQLLNFDKIQLINLKKKDLSERLKDKTPQQFLIYKIIVGDKSDNIEGIFEGLSKTQIISAQLKNELKNIKSRAKFIDEISTNQQLFENKIKNNKETHIYERYIHNKKLIDFTEIPKKFHNIVKYEKIN